MKNTEAKKKIKSENLENKDVRFAYSFIFL